MTRTAPSLCLFTIALLLLALFSTPCVAQMKAGNEMRNFAAAFRLSPGENKIAVAYIGCDVTNSNVLFPGEHPEFVFQLRSRDNKDFVAEGKADLIPFGTRGIANDIWTPDVFTNGTVRSVPIHVHIPAGGSQRLTVRLDIPERMGGYAIVLDLGAKGRLFGTSFVRTFVPDKTASSLPKLMLDASAGLDVLQRLGVQAVRQEFGFAPGDQKVEAAFDQTMRDYAKNGMTTLVVWEAGDTSKQPFVQSGRPWRNWLGDDDVTLDIGGDHAWLPEQDDDFRKTVAEVCAKYGYPRGPITGMCLWNEPWEGVSISGWGADIPRFRTIFTAMAKGVEDARTQGARVLLAGCDSSTNTWDKLFSDGGNDFLKWLDVCSIHYQGTAAPSVYKEWIGRESPQGRVQVWDTESWVANTDERVLPLIAANRASGYDRGMGVFWGNLSTRHETAIRRPDGTGDVAVAYDAWPPAAAIGAVQHFIGERGFRELLFPKGLPWIFIFDGSRVNADDGCVVISGDLGGALDKNALPFRTVKGLREPKTRELQRARLAALKQGSLEYAEQKKQLDAPQPLQGGSLTIPALEFLRAFDFNGNRIAPVKGHYQIPLDCRACFLRTDGSPGTFAKLLEILRMARIDGYEPLEVIAHDALKRLDDGGTFKLTLTNILNRPLEGKLEVTICGKRAALPPHLAFSPFETKEIALESPCDSRPDNSYPLKLTFETRGQGKVIHTETLHVNAISRRNITVDGSLADWTGVLPQMVSAKGSGSPTQTEAAWLPFKKFTDDLKAGSAVAYLAYDDQYFYFAAKVADTTPEPGTFRFEHFDADSYFYPETSFQIDTTAGLDTSPTQEAASRTGNGGRVDHKVWHSGTHAGIGFILQTPPRQRVRVALDLPSFPFPVTLQITDRQSGKVAAKREIPSHRDAVRALFAVDGRVHITLRGENGNPVTAGGLYFDEEPSRPGSDTPAATFFSVDNENPDGAASATGKLGQWLPGHSPQIPANIDLQGGPLVEHQWPKGVRRYSYRKDIYLPSGNSPNFDNVQLAFNVFPQDEKATLPNSPGTMPRFVPGQDTDYEYALNQVAPQYGGGTEVWRLRVPGMPLKNFYPRQPAGPLDGPVKTAKLAVNHDANVRIVEAAIPWTEIPRVKEACNAGRPIKFTFRVNDNKGIGMELAEERSVSTLNPHTFHSEWIQHWGNEVEFSFEQPPSSSAPRISQSASN